MLTDTRVEKLNEIARSLLASGKGLLAADESIGTSKKRFESVGVECTEEKRRDYREMLFTTPGIEKFISGIIFFDETFRQNSSDGLAFLDILKKSGIIPGIKVDAGTVPLANAPGETITEGLDGLAGRLKEYYALGARFAKWRAKFDVSSTIPSDYALRTNAHALARYAALCQEAGMVPIIESEVLMDGEHTIEKCYEVTEKTLNHVFRELYEQGVSLDGILLKPNMVIAGKQCKTRSTVRQVAELTVKCFLHNVPAAVPGVVFLSGGQSEEEATAHLGAMASLNISFPWELSFSFSRALQHSALQAWAGERSNFTKGQNAFLRRAELNSIARLKVEGIDSL